jgi:CheY-like chemotaxis protein
MTRILYAEDNPDIIKVVGFFLKNMRDTEVRYCSDGGEAINALTQGTFDIVVLDHYMPVADGMAVLRWIRERPELARLPVIFLTANHAHEFKKACLLAGAQEVFTKPFNPGLLVRRVRSLLAPPSPQ